MDRLGLFVDASLQGLGLSLFSLEGPGLFHASYRSEHARSTTALVSMAQELLDQVQAQKSDLGGIFVARGPGSFTGIKLGVAFAQGLSLGQGGDLDIWGVSGLGLLCALSESQGFWALPSTTKEGYGAFNLNGAVVNTVLKIGRQGLSVLEPEQRTPVELPPGLESIHFLLPWPRLEASPPFNPKVTKQWAPEQVFNQVAHLLCQAWWDQKLRKSHFSLARDPLYLRHSAPEERNLDERSAIS